MTRHPHRPSPGSPPVPLRRLMRDRAGAAAVEMALVLPILLVLLVHFVDFGLAFNHRSRLEAAARAGAQQAIVSPGSAAQIEAVARDSLGMPDDAATEVTVATVCECAGVAGTCGAWCSDGSYPATYVTVRVLRPFTGGIGFLDLPTIFPTDGVAHVRVQ